MAHPLPRADARRSSTAWSGAGRPLPDLVVADHGWAGCAGQRGVDSVGYADCNDPALFLGEAEGTLQVVVPLDDHVVSPRYYDPMTAYLLEQAGLRTARAFPEVT